MSTRWARNVIRLGPDGIHSLIQSLDKGGSHTPPQGTAKGKRRLLTFPVHNQGRPSGRHHCMCVIDTMMDARWGSGEHSRGLPGRSTVTEESRAGW